MPNVGESSVRMLGKRKRKESRSAGEGKKGRKSANVFPPFFLGRRRRKERAIKMGSLFWAAVPVGLAEWALLGSREAVGM